MPLFSPKQLDFEATSLFLKKTRHRTQSSCFKLDGQLKSYDSLAPLGSQC